MGCLRCFTKCDIEPSVHRAWATRSALSSSSSRRSGNRIEEPMAQAADRPVAARDENGGSSRNEREADHDGKAS